MRLSISNIAWDTSEDDSIAGLLARYGVDAIDIAPGKYFPNPATATIDDIKSVRRWWQAHGIDITGMQSLLFGTTGLNMFGAPEVQKAMLDHLTSVCRIADNLEARFLVFGSPKNRDRSGLDDAETIKMAIDFFRRLGDIAHHQNVIICLEPNPPCYGANFMTTAHETASIVQAIDHPAIKMQFDTGAMTINHEDPEIFLTHNAHLIGHIHISAPNLSPLGTEECDHALMARAITKHLADKVVTIEMVATKDIPHPQSIEQSLKIARQYYAQGYEA